MLLKGSLVSLCILFPVTRQAILVGLSDTKILTVDSTSDQSIHICGSVMPASANVITILDFLCLPHPNYHLYRYIYVYQVADAPLHIFELEAKPYGKY